MQLKNHLYTIVETDKQGNLQQKEAAGLQQKEAAGLQQKCQEVLSSRSNTSFRLRLNPGAFHLSGSFPWRTCYARSLHSTNRKGIVSRTSPGIFGDYPRQKREIPLCYFSS